jgi:hypothetical protein
MVLYKCEEMDKSSFVGTKNGNGRARVEGGKRNRDGASYQNPVPLEEECYVDPDNLDYYP